MPRVPVPASPEHGLPAAWDMADRVVAGCPKGPAVTAPESTMPGATDLQSAGPGHHDVAALNNYRGQATGQRPAARLAEDRLQMARTPLATVERDTAESGSNRGRPAGRAQRPTARTGPFPQKVKTGYGVSRHARVDPYREVGAHTAGPTCPAQSGTRRKAPTGQGTACAQSIGARPCLVGPARGELLTHPALAGR